MSFRAQRGISPFAERKGARGMPVGGVSRNAPHPSLPSQFIIPARTPSFRRKPALQRTERPSRGDGIGGAGCHSERSEASPFAERKGARGMPVRGLDPAANLPSSSHTFRERVAALPAKPDFLNDHQAESCDDPSKSDLVRK